MRILISVFVVLGLVFGANAHAVTGNKDIAAYEARRKQINDRIKDVRNDYRRKVKEIKEEYKDKLAGAKDAGEKKAILDSRIEALNAARDDYEKRHEELRDQLREVKSDSRQARKAGDKRKSK